MRTLTLVTGFEPARLSFERPTSQGHHTFPNLLKTLTPASEHLPTNAISCQTLHINHSRRPKNGFVCLERISFAQEAYRVTEVYQFHVIIWLSCYR